MVFDYNKWDVELIQDPYRLMKKLKELDLKGKTIQSIRITSFVSNLCGESLHPDEYDFIKNDTKEKYDRTIEIESPVIISFTNGDRLEIDFSEGSSVKIGKNSLPKDMIFYSQDQLDGNIFFSNCIGEKLLGFAVEMEDGELDWDFTGSFGIELDDDQELFISKFRLVLSNNMSILFNSCYDYGDVTALKYGNVSKITKEELLKSILIK